MNDRPFAPTPTPGELAQDGRFYMQANYQVPLAAGTHLATLTRLRDDWIRQGYVTTDFRTFKADEATVAVRNPEDGMQLSLISTRPPAATAVIIATPAG